MSAKGPSWNDLQKPFIDEWEESISQKGEEIPDIQAVYYANSEATFIKALRELAIQTTANKKYRDLANNALSQLNLVVKNTLPEDEVIIFNGSLSDLLDNLRNEPGYKQLTSTQQEALDRRVGELRILNNDLEALGKGVKSISDVKKVHQIAVQDNPYQKLISEVVSLYKDVQIDITDKTLDRTYRYQLDIVDNAKILSQAAGVSWSAQAMPSPAVVAKTPYVKKEMPSGLVEYEQSIWRDLQQYEEEYAKVQKLNFKSEISKADMASQKQQISQIKREMLGKYLAYEGPNKTVIRDEAKRVAENAVAKGLFKREQIPTVVSWSHPSTRQTEKQTLVELDKILKIAQDYQRVQADKVKQQSSLKSTYKGIKKQVLSTFNVKHDTKLELSNQLSSELAVLKAKVDAGIVNSKEGMKEIEAILDKTEKAANQRVSVNKQEFKDFIKTIRNAVAPQEPAVKHKKRD
ncbi:hypothetical protein [Candidatus Berkiella aquae]|uniref:Uncharacterized protein n=1 Tax=Candidatus Berkiella aquae TaxID=295108 RepID=A0A0Q9YWJ4_9GAMM|nr:hypothetical protein [Candidatus Berkiella aquae]MCS5712219.1 hypothetical protein [Candidatus Berkiella aquae]